MRPSPYCTSCMPTLFTRSSFPRKLPHPQAWQCSWWDTNPLVHYLELNLELKHRHHWLQKYPMGMRASTLYDKDMQRLIGHMQRNHPELSTQPSSKANNSRGPCLWPVLVRTCMVNHEALQVMWDPSPHSKHMQKSLDIKFLAGANWRCLSVQLSLSRLCLLSFLSSTSQWFILALCSWIASPWSARIASATTQVSSSRFCGQQAPPQRGWI